jgi:hypothetical protein
MSRKFRRFIRFIGFRRLRSFISFIGFRRLAR